MAKRKKQLNKNLIATMVSAAMVLTVAVVAVVTANAARRDPTQLAERAKAREAAGEYREAIGLYQRAFKVDKETQYLVDVSRCAYEMGELRMALGALNQAHSQDPEDVGVMTALLERYWEYRNRGAPWQEVQELSESLLKVEPENLLALVSRAKALEAQSQRDPQFAAQAKDAIEAAAEIDALDPRVVEVRVSEMFVEATARARDLESRGDKNGAEAVLREARDVSSKIFEEALVKNPKSDVLYRNAAQIYVDIGRGFQRKIGEQTDEAAIAALRKQRDEAYGKAEALMVEATTQLPEDVSVMFGRAMYHRLRANELENEDAEACKGHVEQGIKWVTATLDAEVAEYDAYTARANLQEMQAKLDGSMESDAQAVRVQLLDGLEAGLVDTVGLKSIKAVMNKDGRARMLASAFDRAYGYHREAKTAEEKAQMMTYIEAFRDRGKVEFSESVLVPLLDGQYFILEGDSRAAIQAFSLAEDKAKEILPRYELLAKEQLARLYLVQKEHGVALKYTNAALQLYGGAAPIDLWLNRARLLVKLDNPKSALDQCDLLLEKIPGHEPTLRIKASALHALERSDEAEEVLASIEGSTADLMKARIAAARENWAKAEEIARSVIEADPTNTAAMTLAVQVMVRAERQAEALQLIEDTQERVEEIEIKRLFEAQKIVLQTEDEDEREKRLFAVIDEIEDPIQRAGEYFNIHYQKKDYDKAIQYAKELETLKPNDDQVYGILFEIYLRLEDYAAAESYVTKLSEANADRAGGATFRGMLKRVQNDLPGAIEDFRAAERALPTDSNLKVQIGECLWALGEYDATIEKLLQAVDLDPSSFVANKLLYRAYEQLGRENEGILYLQRAEKLKPDDPYIKDRQQQLTDANDPEEGIRLRESIRAEDPEDFLNIIKLGRLYMRPVTLDMAKAEECLQAVRKLAPDDRRMAEFARAYYIRTKDMETGGAVLKEYISTQDRLTQINGQLLLASFYEEFEAAEQVDAAFAAALSLSDSLGESRRERGRRGRLQVLEAYAAYYERVGRQREAIEKLTQTLELYPDPKVDDRFVPDMKVSLVKIIQNLMKLDQLEDAEARIEEFRKAHPDDIRWLNAKGELAARRGEFDSVRELMTLSIEKEGNDAWAYWMRGRANMATRQFDAARQDLLRVKELSPNGFNLSHRMQLAQLYQMLEQYELAETELRELLDLPERRGDERISMMLIRLLRNTGQGDRAQEFLNELIAQQPDNAFWPAMLGQLLTSREEYSAAIRPYGRAVELTEGKNGKMVTEWLQAMLKADRTSELLRAYDQLDSSVVTPLVLILVAEANQKRNNETEARNLTERALRDASAMNAQLFGFVAGRARLIFGPQPVGELLSKLAGEVEGEAGLRVRWYLARGLVEGEDAGQRQAGMQQLEALLGTAEPKTNIRQEILLSRARGFELDANLEGAVGVYEKVLEDNPGHWHALNNSAYLLTELGRANQAVKYAERARVQQPRNANVLDTLGWALYRSGDASRAESVLLEALSLDPQNLAILAHLGDLFKESARDVEAKRYYERLKKIATDTNQRETVYFKQAEAALAEMK